MEGLWNSLKGRLGDIFPQDVVATWFHPLVCRRDITDILVLEAENDFTAIWLQDNYRVVLEKRLSEIAGHDIPIQFRVNSHSHAPVIPMVVRAVPPSSAGSCEKGLNPTNTFENFVVGNGNQLAHAASVAVAKAPARAYNPLFVYGNTGLGKTHLMQAVAHKVLSLQPRTKIVYISTEKFTNEFIYAIQENSLTKFRKKYRSTDVLLIDDIHFLSGKERIQEEFFHTFNELFESQKQIFLCSDRPASEIARLENRLVSRFQWGLVCDVQPPDFETRVAILSKKAKALRLSLDQKVLEFLAERVTRNVRRMEGSLNRLAGYSQLLSSTPLTIESVESILRDILQEEMILQVNVEDIQRGVCDFYKLNLADLLGQRRPANIAFPRQVAMYLSRLMTTKSLQEIGSAFGGRDHGTVMHACRSVENAMQQDLSTKRTIDFLKQKLLHKT
jgi:chromosomal replication initiator protein